MARFILAQYGVSGEVQVLTDTYGRILTQFTQDGDYRTACVYVPGDSRIDWVTESDTELVTLLGKYGYNDALTIVDNNVTINDNGETETLIWDSAAMDFTVDVDIFQNGAQNMYFKTVNDGNSNVTVLVDADGKAIVAPTLGEYTDVLFSVANNGSEIDTITDDDTYSRVDIINACGGTVNVTALDAGGSVFLLVMGTHVQYCNADNLTTTPDVAEWSELPLTYKEINIDDFSGIAVVTAHGKCIWGYNGSSYVFKDSDDKLYLNTEARSYLQDYPNLEVNMVATGQYDFYFDVEGTRFTVTNGICVPAIE